MAYNNLPLVQNNDGYANDGYGDSGTSNSFISQWFDKRSARSANITLTWSSLFGTNPSGTAIVQGSNVTGFGIYGGPLGGATPPDLFTIPTSQFAGGSNSTVISSVGVTNWELQSSVRWIRVQYTASVSSAGLVVYCFANAPFVSI